MGPLPFRFARVTRLPVLWKKYLYNLFNPPDWEIKDCTKGGGEKKRGKKKKALNCKVLSLKGRSRLYPW